VKTTAIEGPRHFLHDIIDGDLASGRHDRVVTRFPPEPNGYLHIGHAKAISVDFGLAEQYGGQCHLRMDDTNPTKEDVEYVKAIQDDIHWLGFDWGEHMYYASDYFERLYQFAEELITKGKAYVDSSSEEEIRERRGTLSEAGAPSPFRDRSVEENLDLFRKMRAGEFDDGAHVLRAKIDMGASNMKMRDPLLYRIRKNAHHYRTGDAWNIYPMYDFAHCLSDAIEGITHSICTLEFENNRELYDWIIDELDTPANPHQYEFARLNLDYTVMSKRKLLQLVNEGHVAGWDDPRMPTIAGLRRRGVTPEAIRSFCARIGVAKANSVVDIGKLEFEIRDDLNQHAPRIMAVLRPLKVVLTNYPDGGREDLDAPYFPPDIGKAGSRKVSLSRTLFIERGDFAEHPDKGFKRLSPGQEVRLRHAYVIRCDEVVKDDAGEIVELRCTYDPDTLDAAPKGRKVKGAIHWVDAATAVDAEVRLYDRLFSVPKPDVAGEFLQYLNPKSLVVLEGAKIEASVEEDAPGTRYQFERKGYFWPDADSRPGKLVFNRIVGLRDSWASKTASDAPAVIAASGADEERSPKSKTRPQKKSRAEYREIARQRNPELAARYQRYQSELGLSEADADVLCGEVDIANFFEAALAEYDNPGDVAKWVVNEVLREIKETPIAELRVGGAAIGKLAALAASRTISSAVAKEVFAVLMAEGGDPKSIVAARGLEQVSDAGAIEPIVAEVLAAHGDKVEQYRSGKTGLLGFFVGQVMKQSGGKANPEMVKKLLTDSLA